MAAAFSMPDDNTPPNARHIANIVPSTARALLGLVEDRGHAPERLCRGLGFTYQDLMDRALLLSHQQVRELILRAQRLLQAPALGLAAGGRQTPVSWGVAGLAMLTCETFGEAIAYGVANQGAAGAMLAHRLEERGREVWMELLPRQFDLQIEAFLVEESLAGAVAMSRHLLGPAFKPLRVDLSQPRPDNEEVYTRFFRCPVRFDAGGNRLVVESHWLGARLPGYDRLTCGLVRKQLDTLLERPVGRHDMVETVANRMRFAIEDRPLQREVATQVNVSERTLRRRLEREATTYRRLRDETRYERARDLLVQADMTIADIAIAVGYSDARAFRRAFKRWSGQLPNRYRELAVGRGTRAP